MAKKTTKASMRRDLVAAAYNSALNTMKQEQAQAKAEYEKNFPKPNFKSGLSADEITKMYNDASASLNTPSENNTTIPTLEPQQNQQNTTMPPQTNSMPNLDDLRSQLADTSVERTEGEKKALNDYISGLENLKANAYKQNYNSTIADLQNQLNDTNAQRTEGETKAIEEYLSGLQGLQAEIDRHNAPKITQPSVKKVEKKVDERQARLEKARKEGKEILQKYQNGSLKAHGYSLSPNESRDMQRAKEAEENLKKKLVTMQPSEASNESNYGAPTENLKAGKLIMSQEEASATPTPTPEQMINLPEAKKETQTPQASDVERYQFTQNAMKNNAMATRGEKIDRYLNDDKLDSREKKNAKELIKDIYDKNPKLKQISKSNNINVAMAMSKDLTDEENNTLMGLRALENKVSGGAAFVGGMLEGSPLVGATLNMAENKLGIDDKYKTNTMLNQLQAQNPGAFLGGQLTSQAAQYMGVNSLLPEGTGLVGKLAADQAADMVVNEVPNAIARLTSGEYSDENGNIDYEKATKDFGSEFVNDLVMNGIINVGGAIPGAFNDLALKKMIPSLTDYGFDKALKEAPKFDDLLSNGGDIAKTVAKDVARNELNPLGMADKNSDVVENAIKQSNEAVDTTERLGKQIPNDAIEKANALLDRNALQEGFVPNKYPNGNGITQYSNKEINNFSSSNKIKLNGAEDFSKFIDDSIKDKSNVPKRFYFGKISDELLNDINSKVKPEKFNLDNKFNIAIRGDEIRHGINDHSLTKEEFELMPSVFNKPDNIIDVSNFGDYAGRNAIRFEKRVDGKLVTVTGVSDGRHNLEIDTIRYENLNPNHTVNNVAIPNQTPTTNMEQGLFNSDIPNLADNVNNNISTPNGVNNIPEVGSRQSKLGTNTMTKIEPEQAAKDLSNGVYDYIPKKEQETMRVAGDRVTTDSEGWFDKILKQDDAKFTSEDVDTSMMLRNQLKQEQKAAIEMGDTAKAELINSKLEALTKRQRQAATNAGQVSQAWAKWSRDADGAMFAADSLVAKRFEDVVENNPRLKKEAEQVADYIHNEINRLQSGEAWEQLVNSETGELDDEALTETVNDIIQKAVNMSKNKTVKKNLDDNTIRSLADQLSLELKQGEDIEDVLERLEHVGTTGFAGIDRSVEDEVRAIFDEAEKYDFNSKQRVQLENQAFSKLANAVNLHGSFGEKLNSWRYFAMLSNPKTHLRNVIGNTMFGGITNIKDSLGALMEGAADRLSKDGIDRTKAIINPFSSSDRELYKSAKENADDVYRILVDGNKYYSVGQSIEANKSIFRNKVLDKITTLNGDLLSLEDEKALYNKYASSLTQYLKANGYDNSIFKATDNESLDVLAKAQAHAIDEAKKATFHQQSLFADKLSEFSRQMAEGNVAEKGVHLALEGTLPFKKTPINILKSAAAYSPLEVGKIVADIPKVYKGTMKASEFIDDIAKGVTGTGLLAGGYLLAKAGILNGANTDDGNQAYSLNIGNGTYTIDGFAPASLPLLIGSNLYETQGSENDEDALSNFMNSLSTLGEPLVETTMLQGVSELLSAATSQDDGMSTLSKVGTTMGTNYATQFVPTELGNIARAVDDTRRSSYTGKSGIPNLIGKTINKTENRIPMLSESNAPYLNEWGEEQKNVGGNLLGRLAYQHLSPGYYQETDNSDREQELRRLRDVTGDENVINNGVSTTVTLNKERVRLSPEELTQYSKSAGNTKAELVDSLMQNEAYQSLDDEARTKAINNLYALGNKVGLQNTFEDYQSDDKLLKLYNNQGIDAVIDNVLKTAENDKVTSQLSDYGVPVNETTKELLANEDTEALNKWADIQTKADAYGINVTKDIYEKSQELSGSSFDKYLQYAQESDKYDVNTSNEGWKAYQDNKFDGYVNEYKPKLKEYGVNSSEELYDTWAKYGADRLEKALKGKEAQKQTNATLDQYNLSHSEKNSAVYNAKGEKGLQVIDNIQNKITPNSQNKYATSDVIPVLNNMNMSDQDKGYYLKNASGYSLAKKAEELYEAGKYADVWYYYELKELLDTNGNGKLTKAEKSKIGNYTSTYGDDILDWF